MASRLLSRIMLLMDTLKTAAILLQVSLLLTVYVTGGNGVEVGIKVAVDVTVDVKVIVEEDVAVWEGKTVVGVTLTAFWVT